MFGDGQLEDDLLGLARLVDGLDCAPHHETFGKVIGDIANPRQAEAIERLLHLRAHTVERFDFGKQGVEDVGAHGGCL